MYADDVRRVPLSGRTSSVQPSTYRQDNMFKTFDRVMDWITTIVKYVMLVQASTIFFIICLAVFTRYLLTYVPSWSEEVPRYLLVWISYLGAALAVKYKEHISLDFFFNLMPVRARQVGHLILNVLIAIVGVIMLVFGIGLVRQFGDDLMESIAVKNFWLYLAMPISGALIVLYIIQDTMKGILGLGEQKEPSSSDMVPI
jgi:TRAP-type C4-dicarboxylate transport system permease small subunit